LKTSRSGACEIALEEAKLFDEGFEPGERDGGGPLDFTVFGRAAIQAAKQRIIQRFARARRTKIRDEFASRVGDLLSGEISRSSAVSSWSCSTSSARRRRSFPYRDRTP